MLTFSRRLRSFQIHCSAACHQSHNTILKTYVQSKPPHNRKALLLFRHLHRRQGVRCIDSYTLLFSLKAVTTSTNAHLQLQGQHLHAFLVTLGFDGVVFLQTALLSFYSKSRDLQSAHRVFDYMLTRNVVCWTALISAYVDNAKPAKALDLFRQMQRDKVEPDCVTLTTALSACADLGALPMGEWIHTYIRRKQLQVDLSVRNALINMYAKCGNIMASRKLFDGMSWVERDSTTFSTMIVGHALHGQAVEALQLYAEMKASRHAPAPNEVTFLGVLMACSHGGLVEEGLQHLESMSRDYNLKPGPSHCGCIVDLLCRAGLVYQAFALITSTYMPVASLAVAWRTLLGACNRLGNLELVSCVGRQLLELEPKYVGDSIAMSNAYAAASLWDEKTTVREHMERQRRAPGCSVIEVENQVVEFVSADRSHPRTGEIYCLLECLARSSLC